MSATTLILLFDSVKITERNFVSEADAEFVERTQKEYQEIIGRLQAWLEGLEQLAASLGDSVYKTLDKERYGRNDSYSYSVDSDYQNRNWVDRNAFSSAYSRKYILETIDSVKVQRNGIIADYFKSQYNIDFDIPSENCKEPWDVVKMVMKACKGGSLVDMGITQVKDRFTSNYAYRDEVLSVQKTKLIFPRVYLDHRSSDKANHLKNAVVLFETGSINPNDRIILPREISNGDTVTFTGTSKILGVKSYKNYKFEMLFASNADALEFVSLFQLNVK